MTLLYDLLQAAPKLDIQLKLAAIYTIIWYFLINHLITPIVISVISNLKTKKRFIHFNRESFKKLIRWDIGDDEEEQIIAIARVDAAMIQHLVGGIMLSPSVFGIGFKGNIAAALAYHAGLSEMGWEIQDLISRCYEIIFRGERGRKLNPPSLMLTLVAHHSAACTAVIPMNLYDPGNRYWHEGFCIVQLGSFVLLLLQQYGYTLDVNTRDGLNKMRIAISISFLTCLWTRIIRYSWLLKGMYDGFVADGNMSFVYYGAVPALLLSAFNVVVMKDAWQKFSKFVLKDIKKVTRDIKTHSQRNIEETIKKLGSLKDITNKSIKTD